MSAVLRNTAKSKTGRYASSGELMPLPLRGCRELGLVRSLHLPEELQPLGRHRIQILAERDVQPGGLDLDQVVLRHVSEHVGDVLRLALRVARDLESRCA